MSHQKLNKLINLIINKKARFYI